MAFEIRHASCHVCGASMAAGLLKKHVAAGDCNARVLAIQLAGEGLRRAGMAWRRFLRLGFVLPVHPTGKADARPTAATAPTRAATLLRAMVLVLLGLLCVLVGLVLVTGRFEVGAPIIGGVLFVGFAAAQFARRTDG